MDTRCNSSGLPHMLSKIPSGSRKCSGITFGPPEVFIPGTSCFALQLPHYICLNFGLYLRILNDRSTPYSVCPPTLIRSHPTPSDARIRSDVQIRSDTSGSLTINSFLTPFFDYLSFSLFPCCISNIQLSPLCPELNTPDPKLS